MVAEFTAATMRVVLAVVADLVVAEFEPAPLDLDVLRAAVSGSGAVAVARDVGRGSRRWRRSTAALALDVAQELQELQELGLLAEGGGSNLDAEPRRHDRGAARRSRRALPRVADDRGGGGGDRVTGLARSSRRTGARSRRPDVQKVELLTEGAGDAGDTPRLRARQHDRGDAGAAVELADLTLARRCTSSARARWTAPT